VLPSTSDIHRTELESVRLIVYHKFKRQGMARERWGVSRFTGYLGLCGLNVAPDGLLVSFDWRLIQWSLL